MPKNEFDPEDPVEMIGVELPGQSESQLRDMALCFAEEFVREGWGEKKLIEMFQNPYYKGPYLAWQQKGDAFIQEIVKEAMGMWRPVRHKASADSSSRQTEGGQVGEKGDNA